MANINAISLDVAAAVGPSWADAPAALRLMVLNHMGDFAKRLKLAELEASVDIDGDPLAPRKRRRPDGASGPVLSPHNARSRSEKWLRASVAMSSGSVTLWWSHGWGAILGYHATGMVRGAAIRNVIGLTPPDEAAFNREAARFFRLSAKPKAKPSLPTTNPTPGKVTILKPGQKPNPLAKKIQVYQTAGPAARAAPLPARAKSAKGTGGLAGGITFVRSPSAAAAGDRVVLASVAKLNRQLASDPAYHIGPGGVGAKPGAYASARAFLTDAAQSGRAVEMPRVVLDAAGRASILDGRSRFAALRDSGATTIPVSVPGTDAAKAARLLK